MGIVLSDYYSNSPTARAVTTHDPTARVPTARQAQSDTQGNQRPISGIALLPSCHGQMSD